ncbi:unnamed protein product [Closterium sp. Naga37s-1]|nr:unnamed protein product [Closterium sp. Naga37s-1]
MTAKGYYGGFATAAFKAGAARGQFKKDPLPPAPAEKEGDKNETLVLVGVVGTKLEDKNVHSRSSGDMYGAGCVTIAAFLPPPPRPALSPFPPFPTLSAFPLPPNLSPSPPFTNLSPSPPTRTLSPFPPPSLFSPVPSSLTLLALPLPPHSSRPSPPPSLFSPVPSSLTLLARPLVPHSSHHPTLCPI